MTDTPGFSVADEAAAGASVVLYYGLTLYAAYAGVKAALAAFRDTGTAEGIPGIRDGVASFEAFIGYPDFADRARRFGLGRGGGGA